MIFRARRTWMQFCLKFTVFSRTALNAKTSFYHSRRGTLGKYSSENFQTLTIIKSSHEALVVCKPSDSDVAVEDVIVCQRPVAFRVK